MSWSARLWVGNELKQSSAHKSSQKQFSQLGNKENWDVLLVQGSHMLLSSPGRKAVPWKFRSVGLHSTTLVLEELYSEHESISGFRQMGWSWLSGAACSIYHLLNTEQQWATSATQCSIDFPFPSWGILQGSFCRDVSSGSPWILPLDHSKRCPEPVFCCQLCSPTHR